jgi:hypothetical protein
MPQRRRGPDRAPPSEAEPFDLQATSPRWRAHVEQPTDDPELEAYAVAEEDVGPVPAIPEEVPAEMAHAVHTHTCTYVLDQDGICRWIVARQGAVPPHVRQCMGAQFVACLDLETKGGLVPELRPGAMGLFVRVSAEGRMVLLRTAPIIRVEGAGEPSKRGGAPPAPTYGDAAFQQGTLYGKKAGIPVTRTHPGFSAVRTWGAEQTVTVNPTRSTNKPRPGR